MCRKCSKMVAIFKRLVWKSPRSIKFERVVVHRKNSSMLSRWTFWPKLSKMYGLRKKWQSVFRKRKMQRFRISERYEIYLDLIPNIYIRCQSPKYENGFKHLWHMASGRAINTNDEDSWFFLFGYVI